MKFIDKCSKNHKVFKLIIVLIIILICFNLFYEYDDTDFDKKYNEYIISKKEELKKIVNSTDSADIVFDYYYNNSYKSKKDSYDLKISTANLINNRSTRRMTKTILYNEFKKSLTNEDKIIDQIMNHSKQSPNDILVIVINICLSIGILGSFIYICTS
jgi:hypothetical protein